MNNIKQITFTGVDENTDLERLYDIQRRYPLAEFGVLLSEKWKDNSNRYLNPELLKHINPKYLNLSLHLCGKIARNALNQDWSRVFELTGGTFEMFKRCQLNVSKEKPKFPVTLVSIPESLDELIIQQKSIDNMALFDSITDHSGKVSVLMDASGGNGIAGQLDPVKLNTKVGYAGGLNPDNVEEKLRNILTGYSDNDDPFWIDMETGVRTNDWFDLDKVEDVLEKCYAILGL